MGVRERPRRRHRRRLQPVRGQAPQGRRLQAARREPGRRAEIFRLEIHLLAGAAARHSAGRRDSVRRLRRNAVRRGSVRRLRRSAVRRGSVRRAREVAVAEPQGNVPSCGWSQVNRGKTMFLRICGAAALLLVIPFSAHARLNCEDIKAAFGDQLADVTCFASADLTTKNPATTPANNSIAGLPPFAFTPQTDRAVISPATPTPVTKMVPGLQIQARIASEPKGEARFLLRLPKDWNGRLVVAGASGTRSEFNGDFACSDYVVQKGYAYASQNKGVLNLQFSTAADPLACRLNPASSLFVRFYDNEEGQPFTRWTQFMVKAGQLAREGAKAGYGQPPRYTYAVGTSNGGYQVRRAVELAPDVFDGGVDWEGTFVDEHAPNLLTDLPAAVLNFPDYVASGFNASSTAAKNIRAAGYPPDIVTGTVSLWGLYNAQFWEVTQCQWQKRLDPAYATYGSGTGTYN